MKLDSPRALKQLNVSGSANISGSLNVDGSVSASSFSGSLIGSAETATSASFAETASFALNAGVDPFPFSGSAVITGSLEVTEVVSASSFEGNVTGSVNATGDILPSVSDQFDIGSDTLRFRDIYLSGSTIFLGNVKLSESEEGTLKIVDGNETEVIVGEIDTGSIDLRLDSLESESGSIRTDFSNYTSSADNRLGSLETESGSIRTELNNYTSSTDNRFGSLETESGSIRTDFNNYTSSLASAITLDNSNLLLSGNLSTEGSISASEFSATTYKNNAGQPITNFFTILVNGSSGSSDWAGEDPYIATKTVNGLLSTDRPIIDIDFSEVSFENIIDIEDEWSYVYRVEASNDNELKLYATEEPVNNFQILIQVIR